jgi:hypothetical protein
MEANMGQSGLPQMKDDAFIMDLPCICHALAVHLSRICHALAAARLCPASKHKRQVINGATQ